MLIFSIHTEANLQVKGFPGDSVVKVSTCQCRERGFNPWVGRIPLEKGMATHPSILARRTPSGQRSLEGPWGRKELDATERLTLSLSFCPPRSRAHLVRTLFGEVCRAFFPILFQKKEPGKLQSFFLSCLETRPASQHTHITQDCTPTFSAQQLIP